MSSCTCPPLSHLRLLYLFYVSHALLYWPIDMSCVFIVVCGGRSFKSTWSQRHVSCFLQFSKNWRTSVKYTNTHIQTGCFSVTLSLTQLQRCLEVRMSLPVDECIADLTWWYAVITWPWVSVDSSIMDFMLVSFISDDSFGPFSHCRCEHTVCLNIY